MMKKIIRVLVPILLLAVILSSIAWYLFVYDRGFTRDVLLQQARFHDLHGNSRISSWYYDLAYNFSGRDANVAIELANQYKEAGNYTKAESTLTNAIKQSGTVELYTALSKTYAEQDKLMDSVALLDKIQDPNLKAAVDDIRPAPPVPDQKPGFYSQYIDVNLSAEGTIYFRTDGNYPTTSDAPYSQPIHLNTGETLIQAVTIAPSGLVSQAADLNYTVGGVVEPVTINDPAIDKAIRALIEKSPGEVIYSNDLWKIEDFTVPMEATQFGDLAKLPYLKKLTIHGFKITDLSFLSGFTTLQILDLGKCQLAPESLETLSTLPALQELSLAETGISTIAGLENVKGLKKLDLHNNTLRNVEVLAGMVNLQELNLAHNALKDLTSMSGLKELTRLDVSYNAITSLEPLAGCLKLTQITAENNQIDSLAGLEGLGMLTYLDLTANKLTDVALLANHPQMETLKLSKNGLTDLSPLESMHKLDGLYFAQNSVSVMPQWSEGGLLRIIDGSNNGLTDISFLAGMKDLAYVYLDYNELTSIEPIVNCIKLVQVNVYGNEIEDVTALTEQDVIVNYDPT